MEEDTNDENEVLKFKVKSLETQLLLEGNATGEQVEQMRLVDEMGQQNRDLKRQVESLQRELKATRMVQGTERDVCDDPQQTMQELRHLYDSNAMTLSQGDSMRLLCALYTQDRPIIRYYREALF